MTLCPKFLLPSHFIVPNSPSEVKGCICLFISPLLPHFVFSFSLIENLLRELSVKTDKYYCFDGRSWDCPWLLHSCMYVCICLCNCLCNSLSFCLSPITKGVETTDSQPDARAFIHSLFPLFCFLSYFFQINRVLTTDSFKRYSRNWPDAMPRSNYVTDKERCHWSEFTVMVTYLSTLLKWMGSPLRVFVSGFWRPLCIFDVLLAVGRETNS